MTPEEAVEFLNAELQELLVPNGRGVEDFKIGDDTLSLSIVRCLDWTYDFEGCDNYRIFLILEAPDALSLGGVVVHLYEAKTGEAMDQKGTFAVSTNTDYPNRFLASIRELPLGGSFRLQLGIPE